jgi:hypothetical protein
VKLRDDQALFDDVVNLILIEWGFASRVGRIDSKDLAGAILDAIDRRTPTAPPEPPSALPGAVEHCPGCNCPVSPDCTMSCDTMSDCGHRPPAATPGTAPTSEPTPREVHEAMQNAPHDGEPYRQARAAIKAVAGTPRGDE